MSRALAIPMPSCPPIRPLDGADRGRLSEANRDVLDRWVAAFGQWEKLRGNTRDRLAEIGRITGTSYATARRYFDALKKHHGDAHVFVDRRLEKKACPNGHRSEAFVEFVKGLAEGRQRASKGAWIELLRLWNERQPIPGYDGHPGWPKIPAGWNERAFYRWAKLTVREKKAARHGLTAAKAFQPLVYRTRRGLLPGEIYLADDVWHDFMVNDLSAGATGRPLEFNFLDVASAMKTAWGWRVRAQDAAGKFTGLAGRDFRFVLAHNLTSFGYRTDDRGTTLVLEHGTATVPEEIERLLHDSTRGRIRVLRGGMEGHPALIGQHGGRAKGNFRMKAALESLHNLIHNLTDGAPGQVGLSRDRRPDELHGLLRENDALMAAYQRLSLSRPDVAALIQFPIMVGPQCTRFLTAIYAEMNARTDHDLEGWDDYYVSEFRFTLDTPWIPAAQLRLMAPEQRAGVEALILADPRLSRPRKMSPAAVWAMGARELTPLHPFVVCAIIGADLAKEHKVAANHMFVFDDADLGPGEHRYEAKVTHAFGREEWLPPGEKYLCFVNPFAPAELHVQDAKGRLVGTCRRIEKAGWNDATALHDQFKRAAKTQADLARPANARRIPTVEKNVARMQGNIRLLRDAEARPAARQAADDAAALDSDALTVSTLSSGPPEPAACSVSPGMDYPDDPFSDTDLGGL